MTTVAESNRNLQASYTLEEQDRMIEEYADAIRRGDDAEVFRIAALLPLTPVWAKNIAEVMGGKYVEDNFNITEATKEFGEGWTKQYTTRWLDRK